MKILMLLVFLMGCSVAAAHPPIRYHYSPRYTPPTYVYVQPPQRYWVPYTPYVPNYYIPNVGPGYVSPYVYYPNGVIFYSSPGGFYRVR